MRRNVRKQPLGAIAILACALSSTWAGEAAAGRGVLWQAPDDVTSRDLFYGPGGKQHEPRSPFTFVKEDVDGTNPKYVVQDGNGAKWKLKLGLEARPETVASRLIWAAGYYANEDYFLRDIQVDGMPAHLHRGGKLVGPNGVMHNVRLKREREGEKKLGTWKWKHSEFTDSREWNGLRVLMAVLNNWDLKDQNNAIYQDGGKQIYVVSDVGAAFGAAGRAWPKERAKDNLEAYSQSKFIRRTNDGTVDFQVPARPGFIYLVNPREYISRVRMEELGRKVPRADAKWIGQWLARLSPRQLRDAFRAAGYSPAEIESLSRLVGARIQLLTDL